MQETFTVLDGDGRLVSTAIHAGHHVRSEITSYLALSDADRRVFSPGGLGSCQQLYDVDFPAAVIKALERKVALRGHYGSTVDNARLATV